MLNPIFCWFFTTKAATLPAASAGATECRDCSTQLAGPGPGCNRNWDGTPVVFTVCYGN